jgi:poly(3-hydroxybutyrate) depolymerase
MRRMLIMLIGAGLIALSAGCAVPQPQNTPVWEWIESNPVSGKAYWIYVPSTYSHDVPAKVVVTCHGTPPFDVSNMHIREWKMLGEEYGCIVVAPDLGATDGILGDGPIVGMLENERVIMSVISELGYRYNIDLANIMITGFSGGGFPTYWVGLRHPEIFSVVVARSCNFSEYNLDGWYPPDAVQTPVKVYYGSHDPGTIIGQSRNGIRYLKSRGFQVEEETIQGIGHERRPEVAMAFFRRHWRQPRPSLPTN